MFEQVPFTHLVSSTHSSTSEKANTHIGFEWAILKEYISRCLDILLKRFLLPVLLLDGAFKPTLAPHWAPGAHT